MDTSMTAETSLFYGLFLESVPILIAVKAQMEFVNKYQSVLLQLSRFSNTTRSLSEVPVELWDRIRRELMKLLFKEIELALLSETYCSCCIERVCEHPDLHLITNAFHLDHLKPLECGTEELIDRACFDCNDEFADFFRGSDSSVWKESFGLTKIQLRYFLSTFNLSLISTRFIEQSSSFMPYFAIGAVHNMSMSVKTDEDSNCSKTTKTLSKKTFLDLDYEGVDCSFRKLYLEYGIKGGEPDENNVYTRSSSDVANKLQLKGKFRDIRPAWRLWSILI